MKHRDRPRKDKDCCEALEHLRELFALRLRAMAEPMMGKEIPMNEITRARFETLRSVLAEIDKARANC